MDTLEIKKRIIEYFKTRESADFSLVILFGSWATGHATPKSDVDIAIKASAPLKPEEIVDISTELSRIVNREIDIVDLTVAHGAILEEVLVKGEFLIKENLFDYERLIKRMWYEKEDDARFQQATFNERMRIWNQ